jgi:formylglycine-generating enzyme required for sulfatase activity
MHQPSSVLAGSHGMKRIPAGSFIMGSADNPLEQPIHRVTISPFWLDTAEVTQADYLGLMGRNPSLDTSDVACPVSYVTWYDAVLYCNARSKRDGLDTVYVFTSYNGSPGTGCIDLPGLGIDFSKAGYYLPTEAQWEYSCRANSTARYFWGDTLDTAYLWCRENSKGAVHRVCTRKPNAFGLYDMCGNVSEWCNDWFGPYDSTAQTDPTGKYNCCFCVHRGGSWFHEGTSATVSARRSDFLDYRDISIGFRCARKE